MLSFKQYLQKYPQGHKTAQSTLPALKRSIKKRLSESKQKNAEVLVIDRLELIRSIADGPTDMVEVVVEPEGIFFRFVDVEIDD
jgi:hypothetical protein